MKLKHMFSFAVMVLSLFFSIVAKTELHSVLGYLLVCSAGMLCGSLIYYIQRNLKNGKT